MTPPPDYLPTSAELVNTLRTPTPYFRPSYQASSQSWPPLHVPSTSTDSHWMPLASTGAQSFLSQFAAPTFANAPSSGPLSPPIWYSQGPYTHPSLAPPVQMPTPDVSSVGPSRVRRPHKRLQPYYRDEGNYAPPTSLPGFLVAGPSSQFQEPPVAGPSRPRQPRHRHRSPPAPSLPPPSPYPSNPHQSYPSPPFPTPPLLCTPPSPINPLAFNRAQKRKRQRADDEDEDEVQRPRRRKQGPSRPEQISATCQVGCAPHGVQPPQHITFANDEPEEDLRPQAAPKRVNRRVVGPRKASTSSTPAPKRNQPKGKPEAVKNRYPCPIAGCPCDFTSTSDMKRHVGTARSHQGFRDGADWPAFITEHALQDCHLLHYCDICDVERKASMRLDALIRHRRDSQNHLDKVAASGQSA
ncbi:hypothetical protein HETIRDRAFT_479489 [Heterobasidion irregulare TC 32-1]|uniref:C2H2-type domain-containing protein n=1 Tax=Heterobasidion irregulare (strain TC 32-1) TaxID=747525 RepID=W4JZ17_HETIT|nr:uncharacterized protein HETIRDRAFT_479489 [Heterobasidion irregulare TC 32-1]ETW78315.1 hypothetical protein HETIRDRAFT_479489 [Heterobasidion irregulare TC 32-1]